MRYWSFNRYNNQNELITLLHHTTSKKKKLQNIETQSVVICEQEGIVADGVGVGDDN
jgi:hypothetical protein